MTTSQTETLEDRAMLDGDPYGMGGSMPGGMGSGRTGSTGTGTTPGTTTTTGGTGTTTTGGTTGTGTTTGGTSTGGGTSGGTMVGSFLGSVNGGVLRPSGQEWFETFGTDPLSGVVSVHRDLPADWRCRMLQTRPPRCQLSPSTRHGVPPACQLSH